MAGRFTRGCAAPRTARFSGVADLRDEAGRPAVARPWGRRRVGDLGPQDRNPRRPDLGTLVGTPDWRNVMAVRTPEQTLSPPAARSGADPPGARDAPGAETEGPRTGPDAGWDWPEVMQALAGTDADELPVFGRFAA
jgi:hypothetical protein